MTGIILSILLPILAPIYASLATILVATLHLYLSISTSSQLLLPMEYSLLIILILYSTNALIVYFIQTHSEQKIINLFGQFVPPEIVTELSSQQGKLDMDGESKILAVFFCDLWRFSNVAEQLNPKQLTKLLNEYFVSLTEILYRHGATIDKYIGDSIMAFWGAPLQQLDHAQRAVSASFDMHKKIQLLSESFTRRGWPGPAMGIGINTGMMNVGNMGSKYRVAYTVIGDAVNIASRVETLTRKYQVPTLVSESTMAECPNFIFRSIDIVQVKGKHNLTKIYQPICRKSELTDDLRTKIKLHQEGIEYYLHSDYGKARGIFTELRDSYEDDG